MLTFLSLAMLAAAPQAAQPPVRPQRGMQQRSGGEGAHGRGPGMGGFRHGTPEMRRERMDRMFRMADANGDGSISRAEMENAHRRMEAFHERRAGRMEGGRGRPQGGGAQRR